MGRAKELVDGYWDVINSGRIEELADMITPDGVVTMAGGVRVQGPEQLVALLRSYTNAFPDMRHEIVDYVESGDKIAVELRISMTHSQPFQTPAGEIPATGRAVTLESVDMVTLDGDRVRSWHAYYDQLAFMQQLGLLPDSEAVPA